jgi:hypothetical protein
MVVTETIFQSMIFKEFILPFLLVFVLVFAILQKTKILGDGKKQLDAIIAFVIGLIFVSVAYPKDVVGNMILFLTVALVITFVALMLFSFVKGEGVEVFKVGKGINWIVGIIIAIALVIAVLWATGIENRFIDLLFRQSWSNDFWTNVAFIAVVAIAIALVLKKSK